jgi:hypothetical protein
MSPDNTSTLEKIQKKRKELIKWENEIICDFQIQIVNSGVSSNQELDVYNQN